MVVLRRDRAMAVLALRITLSTLRSASRPRKSRNRANLLNEIGAVVRAQAAVARGGEEYAAGLRTLGAKIDVVRATTSTEQPVQLIAQQRLSHTGLRRPTHRRGPIETSRADQRGECCSHDDSQCPDTQAVDAVSLFGFFPARRTDRGPDAPCDVASQTEAEDGLDDQI